MDSSEKKVIINENSNTDFTTNLEDKIIENTDNSSSLHVTLYSYLGFFDRESLKDYINDVLEDEEIDVDNIDTFPRTDDDVYIVASTEELALIVKEWLEGYYQIPNAIIAESVDAIPPEVKEPEISVPHVNPMDLTCESYMVIGYFNTDDDKDIERSEDIMRFLGDHQVIAIDTYEDGKHVQDNIAVVIGNPSAHHSAIVNSLKELNYSTTNLLLRFTIKTNVPEIYKDTYSYLERYIQLRYGSLGIETFVNIVEDVRTSTKDWVNFEIDIQSNIPTTIVHSDILAYLGSYCLAVEFGYNWSKEK